MANHNSRLELGTLENWLWEAACVIRGPIDAPKFKDYILPLVFLKRLSDVFEDELQQLGGKLGNCQQVFRVQPIKVLSVSLTVLLERQSIILLL